jgi:hypothetical protein
MLLAREEERKKVLALITVQDSEAMILYMCKILNLYFLWSSYHFTTSPECVDSQSF